MNQADAGLDGSIAGVVLDHESGKPLPSVKIRLFKRLNALTEKESLSKLKSLNEASSSDLGEFYFFPVQFGQYSLLIQAPGYLDYLDDQLSVASDFVTFARVELIKNKTLKNEMILEVKALKKERAQNSSSESRLEIDQDWIKKMPQGSEVGLPRLLAGGSPGVVQGPFGQMFVRGNHANIQYQVDGVQLPDSPSNTFGQAFSPRNIDSMEFITGGLPAEYGYRLSGVVNIVTKAGTDDPYGEIELNYGGYNSLSPHLFYGGANKDGNLKYFISLNYNRTDRGLDTPQPASSTNQTQGGKEAVHDVASGTSEFARFDWQVDNQNKITYSVFYSQNNFQIPNFPSSFTPSNDSQNFFSSQFVDTFGNHGEGGTPAFFYVPPNTNDTQSETNAYTQVVWKHIFSEQSFIQLAPYYKYSILTITNDPINDLSTSAAGATPLQGAVPISFSENRSVHNLGLKGDYMVRSGDTHLIKTGFQCQLSQAAGPISVQTDLNRSAFVDHSLDKGYFESVYIQDEISLSRSLVFSLGLRFDATQFVFEGLSPADGLLQPRVGLSYLIDSTRTKFHVFYGKLFQPVPLENLRTTFNFLNPNPAPYDIKAEKDDYSEIGVDQPLGDQQILSVNAYYKDAVNMLDDAQLLRASIAQPYNYDHGFAYGVEASLRGQLTKDWSEYINYSYQIAQGKGISGGIWAVQPESDGYQYLDHSQTHTVNSGLTYAKNFFWWTVQSLYGSGLRTGHDKSSTLPGHVTFDTSVGYHFHGNSWYSEFKLSGDLLNVFDNVYPITITNGFTGSYYASGRQVFIRLTKTF